MLKYQQKNTKTRLNGINNTRVGIAIRIESLKITSLICA